MVTRRTDARRRRVLAEEFVPTSESDVVDRKPFQAYSYGANRRNQPKTTDLIPKRLPALITFLLLVVSVVAGLNLLAAEADSLTRIFGEESARSFAISGPGTLANWFCTVSLFLCSGVCLQLFWLRKHKRDDYGGMYRVWLLMAGMFFFASVDCAVDLRTIAARIFELLTHRSLLQTPWLMMTIELIVLAIVVIRMLYEVRASRFTLASVILVWLGFVGCIVVSRIDTSQQLAWVDPQVAYGNCMLAGCIGSLVSLTFYTRFVFLHAHGLIQRRSDSLVAAKPKKAKAKKEKKQKKARPARRVATVAEPAVESRPVTEREKTDAVPELRVASPTPESQPVAKTQTPKTPKTRKKPVVKQKPEPVVKQPPAPVEEPVAKQKPARAPGPLASRLAKAKKKPVVSQTPAPPKQQPTPSNPPKVKSSEAKSSKAGEDQLQQELENIDTIPMSKAERRRQRKLAKRAARDNKAA